MSANKKEIISIFISCPDDDTLVKYIKSIDQKLKSIGNMLDVMFEIFYWKGMPGGITKGIAQDKIDTYVKGRYQIYLGIMGTKFGQMTEHEYIEAINDHIATGKPTAVFFGFCEEPINPYLVSDSFRKVKKFKKDISDNKKYNVSNLYFTFNCIDVFHEKMEINIKDAVSEITSRVRGGRIISP